MLSESRTRVAYAVVAYAAAGALDVYSTVIRVNEGFIEANPIASLLVQPLGPLVGLVVLKLALLIAFLAIFSITKLQPLRTQGLYVLALAQLLAAAINSHGGI